MSMEKLQPKSQQWNLTWNKNENVLMITFFKSDEHKMFKRNYWEEPIRGLWEVHDKFAKSLWKVSENLYVCTKLVIGSKAVHKKFMRSLQEAHKKLIWIS